MELTSQTIPAWIIGLFTIYTGIMWLLYKRYSLKVDTRIIAYTFILWGSMFGIIFQFFPVSLEVRGFISRLFILLVCISQAMPITVAYFRRVKNELQ